MSDTESLAPSASLSPDLAALRGELMAAVEISATVAALDEIRVAALGKKGRITELMKTLGALPPDQRKQRGADLNRVKDAVASLIDQRHLALTKAEQQARLENERIDVTLDARPMEQGRTHPIGQTIEELTVIFAAMGFTVAKGPDIESDYYNFTALNVPADHPARQMQDTFYLQKEIIHSEEAFRQTENTPPPLRGRSGGGAAPQSLQFGMAERTPHLTSPARGEEHMGLSQQVVEKNETPYLLRTQTSPVQIRTMLRYKDVADKPPIRVIAPGRTYRVDYDITHTPMFHQIEGLVIDKQTHMGHLKGCLLDYLRAFFGIADLPIRFRPSYFPFTEPSAEVDIGCSRKSGELKLGNYGDWLEIGGCGMVHPNVLNECGFDPEIYQGFAFGMGIERMAMLKYGIPDLRTFFEGDIRWMKHYGFVPLDIPNPALKG